MRRTNGKFDKNGKFEPVSWKEAFDELEKHWRKAYQELGPTGVGIFGSGQYTIPEGVAVVKLLKAGFRSNNIDPNARLCMASAVVGMYQTSVLTSRPPAITIWKSRRTWSSGQQPRGSPPGALEPHRCREAREPGYKIFNIQTHPTLSSRFADVDIIFKPNTDLAIANYILRESAPRLLPTRLHREALHLRDRSYDIGYGMRPTRAVL